MHVHQHLEQDKDVLDPTLFQVVLESSLNAKKKRERNRCEDWKGKDETVIICSWLDHPLRK